MLFLCLSVKSGCGLFINYIIKKNNVLGSYFLQLFIINWRINERIIIYKFLWFDNVFIFIMIMVVIIYVFFYIILRKNKWMICFYII